MNLAVIHREQGPVTDIVCRIDVVTFLFCIFRVCVRYHYILLCGSIVFYVVQVVGILSQPYLYTYTDALLLHYTCASRP